jgi:intracellular septation protein A
MVVVVVSTLPLKVLIWLHRNVSGLSIIDWLLVINYGRLTIIDGTLIIYLLSRLMAMTRAVSNGTSLKEVFNPSSRLGMRS